MFACLFSEKPRIQKALVSFMMLLRPHDCVSKKQRTKEQQLFHYKQSVDHCSLCFLKKNTFVFGGKPIHLFCGLLRLIMLLNQSKLAYNME